MLVLPLHFLQKHEVHVEQAQMVAQLVHHHAPVEMGKALVDVISGEAQLHYDYALRGRGNG